MTQNHINAELHKTLADPKFVHYVMRLKPAMYGVYGIMVKLRKQYFVKGTPEAANCQLSWFVRGEEEWVFVSLNRQYVGIILGLVQATGMELLATPPVDLGLTEYKFRTIWRSDADQIDREAIEQEQELFVRVMTEHH